MAADIRYRFVVAGKLENLLDVEVKRIIRARRLIEAAASHLNEFTRDKAARQQLARARELLGAAAWDLELIPDRAQETRA